MINAQDLADLAFNSAMRLEPGRHFHVRELFQQKFWFALPRWVRLLVGRLFHNIWHTTNRLIEYDPNDGTAIYTSQ